MKKKMAKAHQLAPFAGRREVAGYENRRFYFVLNRHASALCSPEPQRGGCSILATLNFGDPALPQLGQMAFCIGGLLISSTPILLVYLAHAHLQE
jgi:hypothetical protein